jgi:hypothetical protein
MNFKRQASELENFLQENFKKNNPIAVLPNGNLAYKDFVIKKNKQNKWELCRAKGHTLDVFNLKTCAILGAKFYNASNFSRYNELKILDTFYFKHQNDSEIFKQKLNKTKDIEMKDMFIARLVESKYQADYAKEKIISKFKSFF